MDPLKPFRELVDRRLWPVALLLIAALLAVPFLLGRDADSGGAPLPAPASANAAADTEPIVDGADPAARDAARRVIGGKKDPFRAAGIIRPPKPKAKTGGGKETTKPTETTTPSGGGGGGGTGGTTPSPSPTAAPTATPTPAPAPVYPLQALEVRFGTVENPDHARRMLTRLSGLPKGTTPSLLYLGLLEDKQTAVFLVADGVGVLGDGECKPSPKNCETLRMRKGDIEFVTAPGGVQYQVEVLKVHNRKTTSAAVARASRTRTARGGKRWLAKMGGQAKGLRYDAGSGVLRKP